MNAAVDVMVECWQDMTAKNGRTDDAPTLRDAALVTAIRRLAKVTMQRDIWM
jgi:hypothetical protein